MITNQAYLFLIFILVGVIIGLLFDFFRILRKSFSTKDFVTYIEDIIFWILAGLILLYSICTFSNGEIRLFMVLGIGIGILIYIVTFSSFIIKVNVSIITFIKRILGGVFSKIKYYIFVKFERRTYLEILKGGSFLRKLLGEADASKSSL